MTSDIDTRKSISRYLFTFMGEAVKWQFKLQKYIVIFATEAEYIVVKEARNFCG